MEKGEFFLEKRCLFIRKRHISQNTCHQLSLTPRDQDWATYEPQAKPLQRRALDCFTPVVVYLVYLRRELPSSQIKGFSLTLDKIEAVTAGKTGGVAPGQAMPRAGCTKAPAQLLLTCGFHASRSGFTKQLSSLLV